MNESAAICARGVLALVLACGLWASSQAITVDPAMQAPISDYERVPVSHPDLEVLEPDARSRLERAIGSFERSLRESALESQRGAAYGRLGMSYQAHQFEDAARACYENAMALDGADYRWPHLLAALYEHRGNYDEAVRYYRESVALNPDNVPGLARLARVALRQGELDEAEDILERALDRAPYEAVVLAALGDLRALYGRETEAVALYERALTSQPMASQLHQRIAQAYTDIGMIAEAREHLGKAGPQAPTMEDPVVLFMHRYEDGSERYTSDAQEALRDGQLELAAQLFDIASAMEPHNTVALLGTVRAMAGVGRVDEARQRLDAVLALEPGNAAAHYLAGALYEVKGDDVMALEHYRAAVEADPANARAAFMAGNALLRLGRFEEAAREYARLAQLHEKDLRLPYLEGRSWLAAGRCDSALEALNSAQRLAGENRHVLQALSRTYALCGETREQRSLAVEYARRAHEREPGLVSAAALAFALAANGRFDEAIDYQTQAIFDAMKKRAEWILPHLSRNLERYRAGESPEQSWPTGADVLHPTRLSLEDL